MTIKEMMDNPILKEVHELLAKQTAKGLMKYGTTVNPLDYTTIEWLNHFREEMLDGIVYATVAIKKLEEMQMLTNDHYVLMDDVNDLIKLYNEREIYADHTKHYEQLTDEINAKVNRIRQSAEQL